MTSDQAKKLCDDAVSRLMETLDAGQSDALKRLPCYRISDVA